MKTKSRIRRLGKGLGLRVGVRVLGSRIEGLPGRVRGLGIQVWWFRVDS